MAFAIRHKETGELWKGQNSRNHKVYATRGAAKSALSSCAVSNTWRYNGTQVFLGLTNEEYQSLLQRGTEDLQKEYNRAQEQYRRVGIDFQRDRDRARLEVARDEYLAASKAMYKAEDNNRKRIREDYMKWEVVEV